MKPGRITDAAGNPIEWPTIPNKEALPEQTPFPVPLPTLARSQGDGEAAELAAWLHNEAAQGLRNAEVHELAEAVQQERLGLWTQFAGDGHMAVYLKLEEEDDIEWRLFCLVTPQEGGLSAS